MANIDFFKQFKRIHMIGIGGISMSGIAEILKNWGFTVTGSDVDSSEITEKLLQNNIKVTVGHNLEDVASSDVVVYSAAIKDNDPEILEAKRLGKPIIERCDFLGEITKAYTNTIGVSGTHGKTTTTSMISLCFLEACYDPTIQVGAILKQIDGNYRVGNSEYCIIEACEYVESFLKFFPKAEVILNIDNDHLDYFKTFENIKKAFIKYVKLIPKDGLLVINADDDNCLDLQKETDANIITYGILNDKANFTAKNINYNKEGFPYFDVYHNGTFYEKVELSVPGNHNVLNALATISVCDFYGIPKQISAKALSKFTGAHRRFEYVGNIQGASIYDDYGHHPTEIKATFSALKHKNYNESWVVFQPHTYSRTKNLMEDFAKALMDFDNIIVTDIYAARESNTYGVTSKDLVEKINSLGKNAKYISNFDEIVSFLNNNIKSDDIILTLGAGTVTNIGPMLLNSKK